MYVREVKQQGRGIKLKLRQLVGNFSVVVFETQYKNTRFIFAVFKSTSTTKYGWFQPSCGFKIYSCGVFLFTHLHAKQKRSERVIQPKNEKGEVENLAAFFDNIDSSSK